MGVYEEARSYYEKSLQIDKELGRQQEIASSYHQLAVLAQELGQLDEALAYYGAAMEIHQALNNLPSQANIYHQLGLLTQEVGNYDAARRLYEKSLEIEEALKNQAGVAATTDQLASLADDEGQYEVAEGLYLEALRFYESVGAINHSAIIAYNLGIVYEKLEQLPEALKMVSRAVDVFSELEMPHLAEAERTLARLHQKSEQH